MNPKLPSAFAGSLLMLAGCASPYLESPPEPLVPTPNTAAAYPSEFGTVRSIALVDVAGATPTIASVGAPLVVGPTGAMTGEVTNRQVVPATPSQTYRLEVMTERGDVRTFQYRDLNGLQVGDRVRIYNGQLYRV